MILTQTFQIDLVSIILIVGVITFIIVGAIEGLFKVLIRLASSILSAIVSIFLAKPLGLFIYNLGTYNKLVDITSNKLMNFDPLFKEVITNENKTELLEAASTKALGFLNLPSKFSSIITTIGTKFILTTGDLNIAQYLSKALFIAISIVIAGIMLYILISIIVIILKLFAHKLDEIKLINKLNHTLGGVIGIVNGLIFALVFVVIISFVLMIPSTTIYNFMSGLMKLEDDSVWTLSKWLYELDILGLLLRLIGF